MDNLFDIRTGIESAPIVFYVPGTEPMEQVNGSQTAPTIPKKPRALVYQFFEWEQESARYKCILCEKTYAIPKSGGTGSLNNHMIRKHQTEFGTAKKIKSGNEASSFQGDGQDLQISMADEKISSEVFRHKLIVFLICCDQPFTLTENEYFRDLINYVSRANDECSLFCAKTTKKLITDLYEEYKSDLKTTLQNNESKISFVIDCWTSSNIYPFQGVIARWINDEWELCSTVLDLTLLHGSHEGKRLADAFWSVLKDFGLLTKLLSVTTDNASNMDTLFEELENLFRDLGIPFDAKNFRVRCFAHIMNLACQDMINSVGDGPASEYPSDDDSDNEEPENASRKAKVLPVVTKLRKGVVSIRSSPQRRELLARQCIAANIAPKVVLRDVRTRWNATHQMMERAKDLREPFDLTLRSIPKKRKYVLDEVEWEKIDDLLVLLQPFREATEMLSNEHSPTLSRVAIVYQALFDHLEKFKTNQDLPEPSSKRVKRNSSNTTMPSPWLSQAAQKGLEKLEKYYPSTDGLVHIVNTILDPRCKLVWFKATGWPKEWIDHSRKCFTDYYKSHYKPKNTTQDENNASAPNTEPKRHFFKELFTMQMKNYQKASTDDEVKAYLAEAVVDPELLTKEKTGIDGVLGWWKIHQKEFPNLAKMARDFLPASGTGVPVERLFSSGPDIISNKQQAMKPETVRTRICLKAWLRSKNSVNAAISKAIAHKLGLVDENFEAVELFIENVPLIVV